MEKIKIWYMLLLLCKFINKYALVNNNRFELY